MSQSRERIDATRARRRWIGRQHRHHERHHGDRDKRPRIERRQFEEHALQVVRRSRRHQQAGHRASLRLLRPMVACDPGRTIRQIKLPVLALFGELDNHIIAEKNRDAWEAALKAAANATTP